MVCAKEFWTYLRTKGYVFFSGVPCSILEAALKEGLRDPQVRYVPAVKENVALGVASGAYLAGKKSGILIQNSGLGNIINGLTSFNLIYKVPVLMFITWRGYQGKDAPEHSIMGEKTISLLKELGIPYRVLSDSFRKDIDWALGTIKKRSIPVVLILKKGTVQ